MTKVHELSFREMYHRIAFIEAPSNTLDSLMAGCPRHPQENGVLVICIPKLEQPVESKTKEIEVK